MRPSLKGLCAVLIIIGLYYLHRYNDMRLIEKDSSTFVNDLVNATAAKWDIAEFRKSADSRFPAYKNAENTFPYYSKLGKLRQQIRCEIQDIGSYHYPDTNVLYVSATYQCAAYFEKGSATLQVTLYRLTNKVMWYVTSFDLYSSALTSPTPTPKPTPASSQGWQ